MAIAMLLIITQSCDQPIPEISKDINKDIQANFYTDSSMGIAVQYDFRPQSAKEVQEILTQFFIGFQTLDKQSLSSVLTDDFVWYFKEGEDAKGYQIRGADGVIANLTKRKGEWKNVKYTNNSISGTPETIFQSYTVDYDDLDGNHVSANGIDIYKLREGKIASKDSYWKQRVAMSL